MDLLDKELWGVLSTLSGLMGLAIYLYSIKVGESKPHFFSWFVWALLMLIAFFAQISDGAGAGAWVIGVSGFCCLAISIYALFKGEKNITRSDWLAFISALTAIPIWYVTKNPLYAVILVSLIDLAAFFPTFRKSWSKPLEESLLTYTICAVTYAMSIVALENFSFTTVLYPATLIVANTSFVTMLLIRRKMLVSHA